ncbi:MAG: NAD-dependent epimerase/dehydratase family protein [candidate division Zixibacteria bacterium]
MKILVTGGAGFIGSNLASALCERGDDIFIIDNLSTGKRENIPEEAKFHQLDISEPVIDKVFETEKFDTVFHMAAQMDVRNSVEDPANDAEINILGGINLLRSSVKHGVKKFVFSSTGGAIYGEQDYFPADENHPLRPVSPYGISKLSFEKYLYYFKLQFGLEYIALRYANVYGPRQNSHGEAGVVAIFCEKLLKGDKAFVNGDGLQTRDFVYVGDVIKANLLAMEHPESGEYNVGTGIETDINAIYDMIKSSTDSSQERVNREAMPGEQMRSVISYELIKKSMGWSPTVKITDGIAKTVEFFRSKVS